MRLTWDQRRTLKIVLIAILFAFLGALLARLLLSASLIPLAPPDLGNAREDIQNRLGWFAGFLDLPVIGNWFLTHPTGTVMISGALSIGGLLTGTRAQWVHDVFFASFNEDILTAPGGQAGSETVAPGDQPLPYLLGEHGPRRDAYEGIRRWLQSDTRKSLWVPWQSAGYRSLSVAALVGRSGSGKTRLAVELGRELSGLKDRLTRRERFGAYCRRLVVSMPRCDDDPWDVGFLTMAQGENFDQYIARLGLWTPRRATLVVLDDPAPGQTSAIQSALAKASNGYRHAVRLLIVNQTVPSDSSFRYDMDRAEWQFEHMAATPPPIRLAAKGGWFTERETLLIAFADGRLSTRPEHVQAEVRSKMFALTRGNPLLVHLSLQWVLENDNLDGVTSALLATRRAERIVAAFRTSEIIDKSTLQMCAVATLVGGADIEHLEREAARAFPAVVPLPIQSRLQQIFPANQDSIASGQLPAVRPDLIADAFVEIVIRETGIGSVEPIVRTACRVRPSAMLRQITRGRDAESGIGQALEAMPLDLEGYVDRVDLAVARAELILFLRTDEVRPFRWDDRIARVDALIATMTTLDTQQLNAVITAIAKFAQIRPDYEDVQRLLPELLLRVLGCLTQIAGTQFGPSDWIVLLGRLEGMSRESAPRLPLLPAMMQSALAVSSDYNTADAMAEALWNMGSEWRRFWSGTFLELRPSGNSELAMIRQLRLAAQHACAQGKPVASIKEAGQIAETAPDDRAVQYEWAKILRCVADATTADSNTALNVDRFASAGIAKLLERFPGDLLLVIEYCRACACECETIARTHTQSSAAACKVIAEDVAALAMCHSAAHSVGREIARAAARCWETTATICSLSGEGGQSVAHAAAMVEDFLRAYPDRIICRSLVAAYGWEHQAWAVDNAPAAQTAMCSAIEAASAFLDDVSVQQELAQIVAFAATNRFSAASFEGLHQIDPNILDLASRFPDDICIQIQLLLELTPNSRIHPNRKRRLDVDHGKHLTDASDAAERIAERFPEVMLIQNLAAQALLNEVDCWTSLVSGGRSTEAERAFRRLSVIASHHPGDKGIGSSLSVAKHFLEEHLNDRCRCSRPNPRLPVNYSVTFSLLGAK